MFLRTSVTPGAKRQPSSGLRRLRAAALSSVVIAASLGLTAAPASASAPSQPVFFAAVPYTSGIRLYFAPPSTNTGGDITGYRIERIREPFMGPQMPTVFLRSDTRMFTDTTAALGMQYRYRVFATNADGASTASAGFLATRTVGRTDYTGFASTTAFAREQFRHFFGRNPNPAELAMALSTLGSPGVTPSSWITDLAARPSRAARKQVIRLYFAYFRRSPDHGGLDYWTTRIAAGTKNLNDVSNSFASSSEFRNTYGSLSNVEFVSLVYQNVLDRDPEPGGFAFWTGQLDNRTITRGRLMTQFSESNEFKNASKGRVTAVDVWDAIRASTIPSSRFGPYAGHVQHGGTAGDLATLIIREFGPDA